MNALQSTFYEVVQASKKGSGHFSAEAGEKLIRSVLPELLRSYLKESFYEITGELEQELPIITIQPTSQQLLMAQYIYSEDRERLYLVVRMKEDSSDQKEALRYLLPDEDPYKEEEAFIGNTAIAQRIEQSIITFRPYYMASLPDDQVLQKELTGVLNLIQQLHYASSKEGSASVRETIEHIHTYIENKGFFYLKEEIASVYFSLQSKPFLLLSGISGTGKTKLAELFAESLGATEENGQFLLLPVKPDWTDSGDLLGYTNLQDEFKKGPFFLFLERAHKQLDRPFFLVLDEMNLSRVEYYLSEFLSVLETRKRGGDELKTASLLPLGEGMTIPENMYVIGTINMDETTHRISPKVIDRANTLEFNRIYLEAFFEEEKVVTPLHAHNLLKSTYVSLKEAMEHKTLIQETVQELIKVNEILYQGGFQITYRTRDDLCFYMIYALQSGLFTFDQAYDFQLLQKIIPRLEGQDGSIGEVLKDLYHYCTNTVLDEQIETAVIQADGMRFPRTAKKLMEMIRRYERDGFASFWFSS
ncbi:AAA family ATPase [Priestia koreensis]|uniref:McrB family protein n=1 Tax=Priestia koreensis TaxID=284581 RepID=UPI0028F6C937|nr:AAA family ATPase [Priestia koreensis]